jgi:ATP-binding cassette, subfamily B, bacterial
MSMGMRGAGSMVGGGRPSGHHPGGPTPAKPVDGRKVFRRVATQFRPYRVQVAAVCALVVVASILGVCVSLLIKPVFDRGLFPNGGTTGPNMQILSVLVGLMILIPVINGALGVYQVYLTNSVGQSVMRDLRTNLFEHLQSLSLRFFTATRTGEIQSRLSNDVGGLQSVITDTASSYLQNIVAIVSTVVAMAILSWKLTIVSLILVPVFLFVTRIVGRVRRRIVSETQVAMAEMSVATEESLSVSGILLAKVFGRQGDSSDRYREQSETLARLQVRQQMVGRGFFAIVGVFFAIMPAIVYLVAGVILAHNGHLSAGTLVAFTSLQRTLFFPIGNVLQTTTEVSSSLALFERVFGYLDIEPDIVEAPDARPLPKPVRGKVELDNVWFTYSHDRAPDADVPYALKGVSLTVEPGMLAAIVGPSGAGKTTISYLIPRLYDPTRGQVRIDGHDLHDVTLAGLSDAVGMVTQETFLFHASIKLNIAYAKPDATDAEIEAAARAAQIHDRIRSFDEGYDTLVGERGYRLSGGEKQRLAIARVLLKDPRILILDEATSALDTTNERLVQHALQPLMNHRTTIAIAHRLSTIRAADVIFAIDEGRIVESGSHDDLLARGGLYASLYEEQFGGGVVEARCNDGVVLSDGHVLEMPHVP